MMPVTFTRSGANLKPIMTCDVCSAPAHFGFNVKLREAIANRDSKRAGQWFCREHVPAEAHPTQPHKGERNAA